MQHKFDELNINGSSKGQRIESYRDYFEPMDLSEEELEERVELAEKIAAVIIAIFLLYIANTIETKKLEVIMRERLTLVIKDFFKIEFLTVYLQNYVDTVVKNTIKVTVENKGNDYYTSSERAEFIAANEANALGNYREQIQAVENGFKFKVWVTENDKRVRHTHKAVDGTKIDILKPFIVGNSQMLFPKDMSMSPTAQEVVNCRCHLRYTKY